MDIIQKCHTLRESLCASVGEEKVEKILAQLKTVAIDNNLDCAGSSLHDFFMVAEIELTLQRLHDLHHHHPHDM